LQICTHKRSHTHTHTRTHPNLMARARGHMQLYLIRMHDCRGEWRSHPIPVIVLCGAAGSYNEWVGLGYVTVTHRE
jgi:2-keto-3-deoxy-galactonokinase